jgi:hypothetical protein
MVKLENMRRALLVGAFSGFYIPPEARAEVIVMRDRQAFKAMFNERWMGLATRSEEGPVLHIPGAPGDWAFGERRHGGFKQQGDTNVVAHELAHFYASYALGRQPRWLAEGLASYLETASLEGDPPELVVGKPGSRILTAQTKPMPLKDLFTFGSRQGDWKSEREVARFYATSWGLVHYLVNHKPAQFGKYLANLAVGEAPERAWADAFPGKDLYFVESGMQQHVLGGTYAVKAYPVESKPVHSQESILPDAEVHVLRARIAALACGHRGKKLEACSNALAEVDEALRLEPKNMNALHLKRWWVKREERVALSRRALEGHPEHLRATTQLAEDLRDAGQLKDVGALTERAAQKGPNDVAALTLVAQLRIEQGRYDEAAKHLHKALRIAPWSVRVIELYSYAQERAGACGQAIAAQERAIEMRYDGGGKDTGAQQAFERLAKLRTECNGKRAMAR